MIKVVIVDDHAILRRGLTQIITESTDMEVIGEADSSAAAMRLLRPITVMNWRRFCPLCGRSQGLVLTCFGKMPAQSHSERG